MTRRREDNQEASSNTRQSHRSTSVDVGVSRGQSGGKADDRPEVVTPDTDRRSPSRERLKQINSHSRFVLSVSGMCLLSATKFADALTTGIGLAYLPAAYESNPIVRPVFEQVGITDGLLFSSFVIVVAIVAVTEAATLTVAQRRSDGHLAPVVRAVGYGFPSVLFTAVAVHNATVLLEAVKIFSPL